MRSNFQSVREAFKRVPNLSGVSCGAEEITHIQWDDEISTTNDASSPPMFISATPTDIDFIKTMGIQIEAGNDFSLSDWMQMYPNNNPDPHTSYMLNESAVKALGWKPDEAIGKILYRGHHKGIVKAVVRDFHFAPLHDPIRPLVIFLDSAYTHIFQAYVRISGNDLPSTLKSLADTWKERIPHRPFQFHFLDENYNVLYHNEQQTAKIFSTFSSLAIFLACLGLFALTAYTTIQRAKEIGIRKILGAGELKIVLLVAKDFMKLVTVASLIAIPVAWLFMNKWLQNFAYRINIQWWVFALAALSALLIALTTVSLQAIKAALANPVKSLRNE
jgi:putative ABC transport system permease protein